MAETISIPKSLINCCAALVKGELWYQKRHLSKERHHIAVKNFTVLVL